MSNITLTVGTGHPYGVEPDRVPTLMSDYVAARAASQPACLAYRAPDGIFRDGFEDGTMGAWDTAVQ